MRRYKVFLFCLGVQVLLLGLLFAHAYYRQKAEGASLREKSQLVSKLELTDLCLFTEANYTRHLSQADLHTPFQDHPFSFDHFPSGSLLRPPQIIERMNVKLD
jgi:hypothetical protein